MHFRPFPDQAKHARRQLTVAQLQGLDAQYSTEIFVTNVKMWWVMIAMVI